MRVAVICMLLAITAVAGDLPKPRTIVLTEANTVVLRLPIMDEVATTVQQELMKKGASTSKGKPLYLVLNSPGGSIVAGKAIIETAKGTGAIIHTISMFSASMSFIISQYLGDRLVMSSSMLMTHRATVSGVSGQIPGSLLSRTFGLLMETLEIDQHIAARSGMPLPEYQFNTANELWMTGKLAVDKHFADELVKVRCDKSLEGTSAPETINLGFLSVDVSFHKCPLLTYPAKVRLSGTEEDGMQQYQENISEHYNYYHIYNQRKGYAK